MSSLSTLLCIKQHANPDATEASHASEAKRSEPEAIELHRRQTIELHIRQAIGLHIGQAKNCT